MKKILKKILHKFGYKVSKISNYQLQNPNVFFAIRDNINNQAPIVFDIGINHGQTLDKIKKNIPKAIVHGFEASKYCFESLNKKYSIDPSIHLNNIAIGDKKTTLKFNEYSWDVMNSFLKRAYGQAKIVEQYEVPVTTVDAYCFENDIKNIDLLKSDTEGFELNALKGAKKLLENNKIKFVFVEMFFDLNFINQASVGEIFCFLEKYNFSLVQFQDFSITGRGLASKSDALFINLDYNK